MPLLLWSVRRYSASTLKFWNFCFDTRLFAPASFDITPLAIVHPTGRDGFCTPQASSDVPSNSTIGVPPAIGAFAFAAGHAGGRVPIQLTSRVVGGGGGGALGSVLRPRPPPTVMA